MPGPHSAYKAASETLNSVLAIIDEIKETSRENPLFLELDAAIRSTVPSGVYRHWKSTEENKKLYAVLGVAGDVDQHGVYFVTYAALYSPHDGLQATRVLVGDTGFLTPISRSVYEGPRFVLVEKLGKDRVAGFLR